MLRPSGLLGSWHVRNAHATLPAVMRHVEEGEAYTNLARLIGESDYPFRGMLFTDTDVYKTLEAIAWSAGTDLPDNLLARGQRLVELLAKVQEPNGYLNSHVQGDPDIEPWTHPQEGHELYSAGHLFQAAVAAASTGTYPELVDIALRFADLLVERFKTDEHYIDGHPEVEMGLVELFRLTGRREYLDLAAAQIDLRGHRWLGDDRFGSAYFVDSVPLRQADSATGHAVRQLYLLAGAVDVAVERHDDELLAAAERVWTDIENTKQYITGSTGSRHRDESIGAPYELPSDRAYAETCASIAAFYLTWRLLLATGKSAYADAMETVLYNGIAASTSASGTEFFYSNPLQVRTGHDGSHEDAPVQRLPWFSCACCPPNLARLLASASDYLVTTDPSGVQVQHYTDATAQVIVAGGSVSLDVSTRYPLDGSVTITVAAERDDEWTLKLRIPAWCKDFDVAIDGEVAATSVENGYVCISRRWAPTAIVRLLLAMPLRRVYPHPRIDALRGTAAVVRGPVVFAAEAADLPDGVVLEDVHLLDVRADDTGSELRASLDVVACTTAPELLYAEQHEMSWSEPFSITIGPYWQWASRTPGAMRVWLPVVNAVPHMEKI